MPDLLDHELEAVMSLVVQEANRLEENAGFGGEYHDGGAGVLRDGVNMYRLGMARRLPAGWVPFVKQMRDEQDPEFEEYQRLKAKFGDK
jgi:hypothetical protein